MLDGRGPVVHRAKGCSQKSFKLVRGSLTNGHSPRVSRQSRQSANDNGDKMIPGAVQRYLGICLTTGGYPEKSQLGDYLMNEVVRIA